MLNSIDGRKMFHVKQFLQCNVSRETINFFR